MRIFSSRALIALLLSAALLLCGCQTQPAPSAPPASGSQATSPAPQPPAPPPSSEPEKAAPKQPLLEGISLENYPTINGSTANHPLIARLYSELCAIDVEEAETLVNLDLGSTGSIWQNFLMGFGPDILIAYEPPEEVKAEFADKLDEMEIDPLGRDGLVFLANAQNPVESLTVEQLRQIYTAQLTDWSEVGGEKGPIQPFQRNADSGSQTLFLKLLMQGGEPMKPPTELIQMTMGGLIDGVAAFDGEGSSIGYSVYYYANLMYANPNLKLLSVDGVAPSNESIQSGEYPLTNDFYVAIRADEPQDSAARRVRDWLLTAEGRKLLEEESYVWAREGLPEQASGSNPFAAVCDGVPPAGGAALVHEAAAPPVG